MNQMKAIFEIKDRFTEAGDCSELLYAPLEEPCTYQKTRRYIFEFEGDEVKLNQFVSATLVDPISQIMIGGGQNAVENSGFVLDYGMKPGVLDLEKEAVISYYRGLDEPGFDLQNLRIRQRIYVFSNDGSNKSEPTVFVNDICNPAIHDWELITN